MIDLGGALQEVSHSLGGALPLNGLRLESLFECETQNFLLLLLIVTHGLSRQIQKSNALEVGPEIRRTSKPNKRDPVLPVNRLIE